MLGKAFGETEQQTRPTTTTKNLGNWIFIRNDAGTNTKMDMAGGFFFYEGWYQYLRQQKTEPRSRSRQFLGPLQLSSHFPNH